MPAVFVHGITVREARFKSLLLTVDEALWKRVPALGVKGFYWGNMASSLRYAGASIPGFLEGTRAIAAAALMTSDSGQLTMLLLDDPLLELRLLKDTDDFDTAGAGFTPLPAGVEVRNQGLEAARPKLAHALATDTALASAAGKAVVPARCEEIVKAAFEAAGKTDRALDTADLIDPLTRSITASLYREVVGPGTALDSTFRWNDAEGRVAALVEVALGGHRNIVTDKIKSIVGGAAAHGVTFAMRHGLRRRVMESISLFVGDVLAYMANRDQIQAEMEKVVVAALAEKPGPLWLIGHSLGGILCFDYCLRTARTVDRLVTVGSQVGLFGELGAFPALQVPAGSGPMTTPAHVKKWINIYDPDDILSFLTGPVMTNAVDVEFDTGAPFPVSHSEYWNCQPVYDRIVK
jgi:hypothetical protein